MKVVITKRALKDLKALPKTARRQVIAVIHRIKMQPLRHAKKLGGYDLYRVRAGEYRVIIQISGNTLTVIRVGHRKNIYRGLP